MQSFPTGYSRRRERSRLCAFVKWSINSLSLYLTQKQTYRMLLNKTSEAGRGVLLPCRPLFISYSKNVSHRRRADVLGNL